MATTKKETPNKKTTKKDPIAKSENSTAPAPAVMRQRQPEQNGIVRPKPESSCGRVWDIADKITAARGYVAERKDVLEECSKIGINVATCATQYARWRKYHGYQAVRHSLPTKEEREKGLKGVVAEPEAAPMVVTEAAQAEPVYDQNPASEVACPAPAEAPVEVPVDLPCDCQAPAEAPVAMCSPV